MLWQTRIPGQLMKRQQPGNVHLQTFVGSRAGAQFEFEQADSRGAGGGAHKDRLEAIKRSCTKIQLLLKAVSSHLWPELLQKQLPALPALPSPGPSMKQTCLLSSSS